MPFPPRVLAASLALLCLLSAIIPSAHARKTVFRTGFGTDFDLDAPYIFEGGGFGRGGSFTTTNERAKEGDGCLRMGTTSEDLQLTRNILTPRPQAVVSVWIHAGGVGQGDSHLSVAPQGADEATIEFGVDPNGRPYLRAAEGKQYVMDAPLLEGWHEFTLHQHGPYLDAYLDMRRVGRGDAVGAIGSVSLGRRGGAREFAWFDLWQMYEGELWSDRQQIFTAKRVPGARWWNLGVTTLAAVVDGDQGDRVVGGRIGASYSLDGRLELATAASYANGLMLGRFGLEFFPTSSAFFVRAMGGVARADEWIEEASKTGWVATAGAGFHFPLGSEGWRFVPSASVSRLDVGGIVNAWEFTAEVRKVWGR